VEIPAQFTRTARWPDGTVRWVLVDFQIDLPARDARKLVLQTGTPARTPASGLSIAESPSAVTVDTGIERIVLEKNHFDARGNPFEVLADGGRYRAVPLTWAIEEAGPLKAVVRVDGVWRNGAAPLRNDRYRFRARLVFYHAKRDVRLFLTFQNNNSFGFGSDGAPRQPDLDLAGAWLGPATLLPAGGRYRFGSGVEKTWELVVPPPGNPILQTTRFASDGSLVPGDAPPAPLAAALPSYYAATMAWGRIGLPVVDAPGNLQVDLDRFEKMQRAKVDRSALENPPGLAGLTVWGHLSRDLDRWNDYGDLRWSGNGCGTFSGNHYDWVYGMYLQYLRSGDLPYADLARVMARHEIDFDIYHTTADGPAFNYQKNWEDRPTHDNPGNCFGAGRPSHTWVQGYALHWLLTGDHRGKDAFDEILEGVRQYVYESFNRDGYIDTDELRVPGWLAENLTSLWRIDPQALLPTRQYGAKPVKTGIRDVLRSVYAREAAAGRRGLVPLDQDPRTAQPLQALYFLGPAIAVAEEVYADGDVADREELLGLVRRMTEWIMSITYGGDVDRRGAYRPRQIPYWWRASSAPAEGQIPYLLPAADAAGFLYSVTGDPRYRDYARAAFRDYVRYVGVIGPDAYGDSGLRTATSYNSSMFVGTESKLHGWSNRYGQHYLASEAVPFPSARR
jgi:hypothetical protein